MRYKQLFFVPFSIFLLFWVIGSRVPVAEQSINQQIKQLEEMKRGYEARALKHENQAEYLQFNQQAVLETKRHLQLAEENRHKAELVQEQIDQLEKKKEQLKK